MGNNMKRLGEVLSGRMQRTVKGNTSTTLELGTINSDLSLSVDGLSGRIGRGDYMVDIRLTQVDYDTEETDSHCHRLPSTFRRLRAGDRVLVAWVGYEPIIVSIVVVGTKITS
jgi:hypothetical protein